jgi:hypothetical protein
MIHSARKKLTEPLWGGYCLGMKLIACIAAALIFVALALVKDRLFGSDDQIV